MRRRYRWNPDTRRMEEVPLNRVVKPDGPVIIGDIEPYESVITGELITSRKQHRDHLRQHGCVETGGAWTGPPEQRPEWHRQRHKDWY